MYEIIGARWSAIRERYKWCRRSTEWIPPHRLQREKRNAKAERWERPQRKAVSAYFGRKVVVRRNPGRISSRGAQDEGGALTFRESGRLFYKISLRTSTHFVGAFCSAGELGFDTVEAYIKHVLKNIGGAVLDKIYAQPTLFLQSLSPQRIIPNRNE